MRADVSATASSRPPEPLSPRRSRSAWRTRGSPPPASARNGTCGAEDVSGTVSGLPRTVRFVKLEYVNESAAAPLLLYLASGTDAQRLAVGPALAAAADRAGWGFECYYDALRRGRHHGGGVRPTWHGGARARARTRRGAAGTTCDRDGAFPLSRAARRAAGACA